MAIVDFLQGAAVAADSPILGFILRDKRRADVASTRALRFVPWVWPGTFGTSLTITMYRRDADPGLHARVILPRSDALAKELLVKARFIAVMFRDGAPRQAFDVRLPSGSGEYSLATHLTNLGTSAAKNPDDDAHFWESCLHWKEHLEPSDRLSLSWVQSYTRLVVPLANALRSGDVNARPAAIEKIPTALQCVFKELSREGAVNAARRLYSSIVEEGLQPVFNGLDELSETDPTVYWYARAIFDLSLWTSQATQRGRRLPWWDNETQRLQYVTLDGHALQRRRSLDDYWERLLIYDSFHIDWGHVVGGSSVPCNPQQLVRIFAELISAAGTQGDADTLLADLNPTTLQLPGPLTRQRIGGFTSHRAFWAGGDLATIAETVDGEFFVFVTAKGHGVQVNWFAFPLAGVQGFLDDEVTREERIREIEEALRVPFVKAAHSLLVTEKLRLFDIDAWEAAPLQMEIDRIKTKQYPVTHWRNNSELRPSDLYAYLKSRFGDPNGAMTAFRQDTSDNIFHWQYNVRVEHELLCILASSSGVMFRASTPKPVARGQQWELIKRIKNDFAAHGRSMSKSRGSLEPWALLLNPYQRVARLIRSFENELENETSSEPMELTIEATKIERSAYLKALRDWATSQGRVDSVCFSIESYTPIMCEAFVNLVLFVLARPEVRDDEILYQSILRQGIDLRIRGLHVHCHGFERAVDSSDARYQRFLKMRERRNLLLHGNLDPKVMVIDRLYFDGKVPVFHSEGSVVHRRIRANASLSDPISAKQAIRDVHAFVDLVLASMKPEVRDEIVFLSEQQEIGYREDTGRLGVLFGDVAGLAFDLPDGHVVAPAKSDSKFTGPDRGIPEPSRSINEPKL